jgi:L-ascorbate metabolism protein UlaG (beta-lactamase superfamily)
MEVAMKIKWLGVACFLITGNNGLKIIMDPYEIDPRGNIKHAPVLEYADIVTVSHEHGDHNHTADIKGNPVIVRGVGKQTVKGIEFRGIASFHDNVSGAQRGPNNIFCFTLDDIRVCHCADLGHALDDNTLKAIGHADVLIFPTGGPPQTIDLPEAVALWDKMKPGVVIPMHYRIPKLLFPKYGVEDLLVLRPDAVKTGKSEIELTAGKVPSGQIMIMEPAL